MAFIVPKDFYLEVSKGNVPKHSRINKYGINPVIDAATAPEDVWYQGGIWTAPLTAKKHNIASSDVNDTSAGTGARTVFMRGLDANYDVISETVTLNGTSNVATANEYIMIDYMYVATAGSSGTAAGTITATAQTYGTITHTIPLGYNQGQFAIYQIPAGHKGYVTKITASMYQKTANNGAVMHLMTKTFGGVWLIRREIHLLNIGNNLFSSELIPPLQLPEKTIIKLNCFSVDANSTSVAGGFDIVLVQD